MSRPLVMMALCALFVTGCQQRASEGIEQSAPNWSAERVSRLVKPPREQTAAEQPLPNVPLPRRRPEQLAVAVPPPQSDAKQEPPVSADSLFETDETMQIDQLVGLDFDGTKALLGQPALDEVQPPARVWAYNGSGCVLNIFFYPHVDGSTYRALTYEVKGGEDTAEFRNRCFSELVREKAQKGT